MNLSGFSWLPAIKSKQLPKNLIFILFSEMNVDLLRVQKPNWKS